MPDTMNPTQAGTQRRSIVTAEKAIREKLEESDNRIEVLETKIAAERGIQRGLTIALDAMDKSGSDS